MLRIPGFIDIGTDISGGSWQSVSNAALRGGYTSLIAAPVAEKVYTEKAENGKNKSHKARYNLIHIYSSF